MDAYKLVVAIWNGLSAQLEEDTIPNRDFTFVLGNHGTERASFTLTLDGKLFLVEVTT